jgi:hypothetical protein
VVLPLVAVTLLASCSSTPIASSQANSYGRLPPAPSSPTSAECSIGLTHYADGSVQPLLCPNGGINVQAWFDYAPNNLMVMAQPRNATESQVFQAMCSDVTGGHTTFPIEANAEKLAAHYNGWSFGEASRLTDSSSLSSCQPAGSAGSH